jgi:hypothetical protein
MAAADAPHPLLDGYVSEEEDGDVSGRPLLPPHCAPERAPPLPRRRVPSPSPRRQPRPAPAQVCRICRMGASRDDPLYWPCRCSGSIKYVHQQCLLDWLRHSGRLTAGAACEVRGRV